jgi:hypothetical protein
MTIYTTRTSVALVELECWVCYMPFAIPEKMYTDKKACGGSFYCPKGCHLGMGVGEIQKLKDELAREKQAREQEKARLDSRVNSLRDDRDAALRREAAQKGAKTRIKNRVANGVCPCCNRSFQNLHNHMKNQHPTFAQEGATP